MATISTPGYYIVEMSTQDHDRPAFSHAEFPVTYRYIFADEAGIRSSWSELVVTDEVIHVEDTYDAVYRIVLTGLPAPYSGVAHKLLLYRKKSGETSFSMLGTVKPEDEGIFVDYNETPGTSMPCTDPVVERYESSIRWSEAGSPSHLRLENLEHVQDGDGDEITGAALLYGNLIVFKNNSIHRYALQGTGDTPLSRYDVISPDIGCIAPRTVLTVHNRVFFLSWEGWYSYDNNVLQPIDRQFRAELLAILHTARPNGRGRLHPVHLTSSGYNPAYGELYLNLPRAAGENDMACTFVVAPERGYATKIRYMKHPDIPNDEFDARTARIYHTNTLGELRSADRFAAAGFAPDSPEAPSMLAPAGIYIEAPTTVYRDEILNADGSIFTSGQRGIAVHATAGSKYFTGAGTHFISRIRKLNLLLHRVQQAGITTRTATRDLATDLSDEGLWLIEQFSFIPTAGNLISIIPRTPYEPVAGETEWFNSQQWNDLQGKPIRFAFDIDTDGYAELLAYALYWRPIQTFLL